VTLPNTTKRGLYCGKLTLRASAGWKTRITLTSLHRKHRDSVNEHGIAIFGHEGIAALAYTIWLARGCPEGSPEEDWFHATQELGARELL
jgi:hypothetical protein